MSGAAPDIDRRTGGDQALGSPRTTEIRARPDPNPPRRDPERCSRWCDKAPPLQTLLENIHGHVCPHSCHYRVCCGTDKKISSKEHARGVIFTSPLYVIVRTWKRQLFFEAYWLGPHCVLHFCSETPLFSFLSLSLCYLALSDRVCACWHLSSYVGELRRTKASAATDPK